MKKVFYIGKVPCNDKMEKMFIKASIEDGKLSISGVIGPRTNGNSGGGCGQIDMEFSHRKASQNDSRYSDLIHSWQIEYADGWDADKWLDLLDIWHDWHLNDMKASCEHQSALGWDEQSKERVNIYEWKLNSDTLEKQRTIEHMVEEVLKRDGTITLTKDEQYIYSLAYSMESRNEDLGADLSKLYKADGVKQSTRGSLYASEHMDGILCKPCPTCGYEYGTSWKKRTLPEEVTNFISNLPDSKITPAWV